MPRCWRRRGCDRVPDGRLERPERPGHGRAGVHRQLARLEAAGRGRDGGGAAARRGAGVALRGRRDRGALRGRAGRHPGLRGDGARDQRARRDGRVPPGGTDDRGHGEPVAAVHVRDQHPRHLQRARGVPRRRGGRRPRRARGGGLLGQGLRQPRGAALPRGLRAPAALPVRRVQGGHRHDRALVRGHLRPARWRSRGSPTSTAAATSTSRAWCPTPCARWCRARRR